MRLTKKRENDVYVSAKLDRPLDPLHPITTQELDEVWEEQRNKLGQLEDIEEELGIDLITFVKLVLNGCYVIDHWKCDDYEKTTISHFTFCRVSIRGFLARYNSNCEEHHFAFQDYGKTWALTKEELL